MSFRLRRIGIDTQSEHVVFIHERAVAEGALGFQHLDRVKVTVQDGDGVREIIGVLNFCRNDHLRVDEIGLSEDAFADLDAAEGAQVEACHARPPESVDRVRRKLSGARLSRDDFDAILADVAARRYAKPELSMFVLACALQRLDLGELVAFTRAMIDVGSRLRFDAPVVADKHSIGGVPGNRTTMVVVPILVSEGVAMPKTSSRAITSAAGTADTMGVLAEVALDPERIRALVERVGGCIAWGGALDLAPADDVLITVERPMGIDTESQMIASILAKKKTAGATHTLLDMPLGPTAKLRSREDAERLGGLFRAVAAAIELDVDVLVTGAAGPVGRGVGPRLEALDVLAVLRRDADAPADLREKSILLAGRLLENVGRAPPGEGEARARQALDRGAAERSFEAIVDAQGRREPPPPAACRGELAASRSGRIVGVHCWEVSRVARHAGAPANVAAGVRLRSGVGEKVEAGEPWLEVHAQSRAQLRYALEYAKAREETLLALEEDA